MGRYRRRARPDVCRVIAAPGAFVRPAKNLCLTACRARTDVCCPADTAPGLMSAVPGVRRVLYPSISEVISTFGRSSCCEEAADETGSPAVGFNSARFAEMISRNPCIEEA